MLQSIRDNAQGWLAWVIVILIAIPFALWGIHEYLRPTPKRVIAEVNGVELSERDFQQQVAQRRRQLQAMLQNQDIDLSFMDAQIRQSTLTQMIEEELLFQTAIDSGMRISNELLNQRIQQMPTFQGEEGIFSQTLYERALQNQGISPTSFEMEMRRAMLTDQLREGVLRSVLLTDYDQQQQQQLEEQQRYISYVIIPTERFQESVTISDTEIEDYYNQNTNRYMTPEQVSVEYVELSQQDLTAQQAPDEETLKQRYQERKTDFVTPAQWQARHILLEIDKTATEAEVNTVTNQAQEILTKIQAGESFEELAKTFSDDAGSKNQGGDLGWFGPGAMVKPFEEAVKAMEVGAVSEPIRSEFGFHLIKLEASKPEVTRSFEEVRDQLAQDLQTELAEAEFYGQVEQFANLAFEHPHSLDVLAETLNLPIKTTELFERTSSAPPDSILSHRKFIDSAFSDSVLKEGYNSEVIDIGEQHVVVLRLKDHKAAQAKPLAEVKTAINTALTKEKTKEAAQNLGKTILDQIKEPRNPDNIVNAYELSWSPAQWIKRHDTTLKQPELVREAFKMGHPTEHKALYQGIELSNGNYALVTLLDVKAGDTTPPDNQTTDSDKPEQQRQAFGESEFQQLVSTLKATAKIKDYSSQLSDS